MGNPIACNHDDTILVLRSDGSMLRMPVAGILAIDTIVRHCSMPDASFELCQCKNDKGKMIGWVAKADEGLEGISGVHPSPWGAVLDLAQKLARKRP